MIETWVPLPTTHKKPRAMPPPSKHPNLTLQLVEGEYVVEKIKPTSLEVEEVLARLAQEVNGPGLLSFTRTREEISIVRQCREGHEDSWRCIKVRGPLEFGQIPFTS